MLKAHRPSVANGSVSVQTSETMSDRVEQILKTLYIQNRILLTSERSIRKIFSRTGRTDSGVYFFHVVHFAQLLVFLLNFTD